MSTTQLLNKNVRSMPSWVSEVNERVGPRPPPPPINTTNSVTKAPALPPKLKNQPEPDYEVIEFNGQQYSNEPLKSNKSGARLSKTPDNNLKCTLCGSNNPWVTCTACAGQIFCASCDDMFHKHPKRKNHVRKAVEFGTPPVPPKALPGQPGPVPPVAPPRRSKKGLLMPLMPRKDQMSVTNLTTPPSPTPSQSLSSWHEHVGGTLKRGMSGLSMSNRPLPDTPKTPSEAGASSRSNTPKSVFDNIVRPPSVQLEKIKNKANATLDRMAILQQRYRQKEQRERQNSISEQLPAAFDHWSNISPSSTHFRSGSMSSDLNSSHFDLSDDTTHFNSMLFQRQQQAQRSAAGLNCQRNMSTSVFNLNAMPPRRSMLESNNWLHTQRLQQAQSMAQLNCPSCQSQQAPHWPQHMHPDDWQQQFGSQQRFNHSNLSLNVGAGYMLPHPHQQQQQHPYPPPVFMNQRGIMPQAYTSYPGFGTGMPVMNPAVLGIPPVVASHTASRAGSRFGSPTPSRKSNAVRRKRNNYVDDELTDDEDSDQDDRRSMISNRSAMTSASRIQQHHQQLHPRQRRLSSASQLLHDGDVDFGRTRHIQRQRMRERRDSVAKSVQNEWQPERRDSSTLRRNESGFSTPTKTQRIYSDLDSEGSGARALVQAKIQQKLQEEQQKRRQKQAQKTIKKPQVEKKSTEVQAGHVVPVAKHPIMKQMEEQNVEETESERNAEEEDEEEMHSETPDNEDESEEEYEEEDVKLVQQEEEKQQQQIFEEGQAGKQATENIDKILSEAEIDEDAEQLGPPPTTPDYEWECEFCTFVNEANIKICAICCKTPSRSPSRPKTVEAQKPVNTATQREQSAKTIAQQTVNKSAAKNINKKMTTTSNAKKEMVSAPKSKLKNEYVSANSIVKDVLNKETVENVWTTLDESIQAQADQVLKKSQKDFTVCDTPSVREIQTKSSQKPVREMGTSPPPQSISTQTYDSLPYNREEILEQDVAAPLEQERYKTPEPIKLEHRSTFHRSSSMLQQDAERYRSNNDLRYIDGYATELNNVTSNAAVRRPSLIKELKALQNLQQSSPFSLPRESLSYEPKMARDPETELHIILKELELYKFTVDELQAALKYCGTDTHPIQWLRDYWHKLVQTVQSLATKYGQERAENTIGTISQSEAREALRLSSGNVWQAVSWCIEQRQRKYRELSSRGNFLREDIVTALTTHQGNVEQAFLELNRTQLKPFLMRIWGSPGGAENESGASNLLHQSPIEEPNTGQMRSDIHDFLNIHALDCLQTPNATGANDYSTSHTSFDYSNNNIYTHLDIINKSTTTTPSPYQLEDATLKNLEILIGNMEQNHAKQNQEVLKSIESMLENFKGRNETDLDNDPEIMRIMTKSPIVGVKTTATLDEKNEADVKNFVWQHIQEIVPNLVQQVEQELMEQPEETAQATNQFREQSAVEPAVTEQNAMEGAKIENNQVDMGAYIMEEMIKPNLRNGSIREELPPNYLYATEIANFKLEFDRGLELEHESEWEFNELANVERISYKMYTAPQAATFVESKTETMVEKIELLDVVESRENHNSVNKIKNQTETAAAAVSSMQAGAEVKTKAKVERPLKENPNNTIKVEDQLPSATEAATSKEVNQTNDKESNVSINSKHVHAQKMKKQGEAVSTSQAVLEEVIQIDAIQSEPLKSQDEALNEKPSTSEEAQRRHKMSKLPRNAQRQGRKNSAMNGKERQQKQVDEKKDDSNEQRNTANSNERTTNAGVPTKEKFIETEAENTENIAEKMEVAEIVSNDAKGTESKTAEETIGVQLANIKNINKRAGTSKIPVRRTLSTASLRSESSASMNTPILITEETKIEFKKSDNNSSSVEEETKTSALEKNQREDKIKETIKKVTSVNDRGPNRNACTIKQLSQGELSKSVAPKSTSQSNVVELFQDAAKYNSQDEHDEEDANIEHEEEVSEVELFSVASNEALSVDDLSSELRYNMQSPASASEVLILINNEQATVMNELMSSVSNTTINSNSSQGSKVVIKEFIPSGDPAKQNLSELVEDTQRLIKQMRDEISIDEFESTDDDYEYSDDYDEGEEEDWYDSEGEEEGGYDEENELSALIENESSGAEDDYDYNESEDLSTLVGTDTETLTGPVIDNHHKTNIIHLNHEFLHENITEPLSSLELNGKSGMLSTTATTAKMSVSVTSSEKTLLLSAETATSELQAESAKPLKITNNSQEVANTPEPEVSIKIIERKEAHAAKISMQESPAELQNLNQVDAAKDISTIISDPRANVLTELPTEAAGHNQTTNTNPEELSSPTIIQQTQATVLISTENIASELSKEMEQNSKLSITALENPITADLPESLKNKKTSVDATLSTTKNSLPELPAEIAIATEIITHSIPDVPSTKPPIEDSESRSGELLSESVSQNAKAIKAQKVKDNKKGVVKKDTSYKDQEANMELEQVNISNNDNEQPSTSKAVAHLLQASAERENKPTEPTTTTSKSSVSKIPKLTETTTTKSTKKIAARSKSFSGPPPPIGISSVRAIQQEFLQKQNLLSTTSKVPTKTVVTVTRKKSINDVISKLTKPATTANGSATGSHLFKTRTQPRLPKKKYHETCFSDDDYDTTTEEEEPEPLEVRLRKQSVPVFKAYPNIQELEIEEPAVLARKYVEKELVANIAEAQIAATLVNMKFQEDVALWAAKECSDLDQAISMLQQECELCMHNYPMNQIVSMLKCTHKCCKQCAKSYFTVQITDRSINDCNCPFCKMPELDNTHEHEDESLEYFSNLDIFLKNILDNDVHELFQRKLRDRTLLQDPNFKWCIQCSSGFFARPKQKRLICPDCGSVTCAQCRKPWEKEHEGSSCEAYLEWKRNNDPELQVQSVQEHLAQNGIDCPKCKFRYSLARGGCMHFTCTQCKFEFCYGCARPFMMGAKCIISAYCAKLGLHAHHPRNCLFYLRDKIPLQLQFLLKENGVSFEVEPIELTDELSSSSEARAAARCPIPLQKETPQGLVDAVCNSDVPDKHAGMCRNHYVEYLAAKIAKAGIDPLPIFDLTDCVQELRRRGIALPERGPWDTDEIYKNMCIEVIKNNIPLQSV